VVHQFKLIEILFTVDQLVKGILEAISSFFVANMLKFLNNTMCFF